MLLAEQVGLGEVAVPDGQSGPWRINSFTVLDEDQDLIFHNLSVKLGMTPGPEIGPGTYKKLSHKQRGTVMSNTPMEIETNRVFCELAKGHVLIGGLGMGMITHYLNNKPGVDRITILELDPHIIELTAKHVASDKLEVIHADVFTWRWPPDAAFDYCWFDIWDTFSPNNLLEMSKLERRYSSRCGWIGCWGKKICQWMRKQDVKHDTRIHKLSREIWGTGLEL